MAVLNAGRTRAVCSSHLYRPCRLVEETGIKQLPQKQGVKLCLAQMQMEEHREACFEKPTVARSASSDRASLRKVWTLRVKHRAR